MYIYASLKLIFPIFYYKAMVLLLMIYCSLLLPFVCGGLCVGHLLCDVALWNQFVGVESWLLDFYFILPCLDSMYMFCVACSRYLGLICDFGILVFC